MCRQQRLRRQQELRGWFRRSRGRSHCRPESDDHRVQLDTLIYPICFCARHHVELFLKEQIELIKKMRGVQILGFKSDIHDLKNLWDALIQVAAMTDRRFAAPLDSMKSTILDFAQIDPTGQTFRYPKNTESVKHLVQTPVINVPTLRREFMKLAEHIKDCQYLCDAIGDEYRKGTFTSKLSRHDLETIALALPPRADWATSPEFDEVKARLMAEYGLSGNDFRRALCLIQDHREFCAHIGMRKVVPNFDISSLGRLNQLFNGQIRLAEMPGLELVAFSALFEISSLSLYSEDYEKVERNFAADFDSNDYDDTQTSSWARQLDRLVIGLRKVGQPDLAEHLKRHVDPAVWIERQKRESEAFARLRGRVMSGDANTPRPTHDGSEPLT